MVERRVLKQNAKEIISDSIWILLIINIIIGAVSFFIGLIPVIGILSMLTGLYTMYLTTNLYLNLTRGIKPKLEDVFKYLEKSPKGMLVGFLVGLFTALWSMLLVIPGIIMGLAYSQAMYIHIENPNLSAMECIRRSKEIMRGHKGELFVLHLSFIGWALLTPFTFGLINIYLIPYTLATLANFYLALMGRFNPNGPSQQYTAPNQGYYNQQYAAPNQGYNNQQYTAPNQGYNNQQYTDPNQGYNNQQYTDPNQGYNNQQYTDPNQGYNNQQ